MATSIESVFNSGHETIIGGERALGQTANENFMNSFLQVAAWFLGQWGKRGGSLTRRLHEIVLFSASDRQGVLSVRWKENFSGKSTVFPLLVAQPDDLSDIDIWM